MKILRYMDRMTLIFATSLICLSNFKCAFADQEFRRTPAEMKDKCPLVFTGVVSSIKVIDQEVIDIKDAKPVVVDNFAATINITQIIKGNFGKDQMNIKQIMVRYRISKDGRYKGEQGPDLEKNSSYVFYVNAFGKNESGELIPYLQNSNHILKTK